jgi:hypothetical protein
MICAFLFIAISSAGAFHALEKSLKGRRAEVLATVVALLFTIYSGVASWRIFVSDDFWDRGEGHVFVHGETLLTEALPLSPSDPPKVVAHLGLLLTARSGNPHSYKTLSYANWLPTSAEQQAFSRHFESLIPLYREVVAPAHIRVFGGVNYPKSFSVRFDEAEASALSSFGWSLTIDCKDGTPVKSFRIPTFMMDGELTGFSQYCKSEHEYRYSTTWVGPPTELKIVHGQALHVEIISPAAVKQSEDLTFVVNTGDKVVIKVTTNHSTGYVRLYMAGEPKGRMPSIRSCRP